MTFYGSFYMEQNLALFATMKKSMEKWATGEIILFAAFLHTCLLLSADYYLRRYNYRESFVREYTYCISLIMVFCVHEITVKITRSDDSMKKLYI